MVGRHRFWLGAAGLAAVAVMLVTAVGASADRAVDSQSITGDITFYSEASTDRAWAVLIPNFNRIYPNVHVTRENPASAQRAAVLGTRFQAGNAPDVMMLYAGRASSPSVLEYAQAGYLADLSKRPWAKRMPPWVKPLVTVNGKIYGWMQRSIAGPAVPYNRDIFNRLGLKVPTTFAQWLTLCQTIRQKDPSLTPIAYTGGNLNANGAMPVGFASSTVYGKDQNWNAKRARGQVTFQSTPGWRLAVQHIVDMKNAGCFSSGVAGVPSIFTTSAQVASGQAAMVWLSDGGVALIRAANPKANVGIFEPPGVTAASTHMTLFPFDALAVNKKSKNLAAAYALVDFLAREKQANLFSRILGESDPFTYAKVLNPKIGAKALDNAHKFTAPFASTGRIRVSGNATWPSSAPYVAMGTAVQGLFTGQSSVDDVLKAGDDAWPK
jgi:raffinose/stachyose/melibiose transport system substrate-binding protein